MNDLPLRRRIRGAIQKHSPGMITCVEFEDFIQEYLDGTLPPVQVAIFDIHMVFCPECRTYLAQYRKVRDLGAGAFDGPEPEIPDDLMQAILRSLDHS